MLPSGTLTFLFTDIEGSTQRWDRNRAAMESAVRRHDAILHEAVKNSGGTVFKTIGDAFCAVFARPEEAVTAILASQRALAVEDFSAVDGVRVRMALHTGTADERDGDYYGPALNRVARLLAIGHGGQMLLSRLTADIVRDALPSGVTLRELGLHKLKDLAEPEHVHQLIAPELPDEFPPLKSTGAVPNNLPAETTSFVGRETELTEVAAALEDQRLVTLLAMGGIGKTRLSLQVAANVLERFPNGVWFVEFAATTDAALVAGTIASTIGAPESAGRPPLETLVAHLKHDSALLILDNCEHLIGEIAKTAETVLRSCPKVKILASSREPIGISGEVAYRLSTLGMPESVALFAARATAANRQFALTPENEPVVNEICRRLDGIALAIELAAARVKMLSVKVLAEKLDDRFRIVAGGSRTALPRQQTLRALIDWSYDLLSQQERTLFRRLAIFAGGFTAELCVAVCAGEILDEFEISELLFALVEKSLVHTEIDDDETRYGLLETIREYAREKLVAEGTFDVMARAHAVGFAELASRLESESQTMPESAWKARAKPELENWRAALSWGFGQVGDRELAASLAAATRTVWTKFAVSEGRRWIGAALEVPELEKETLARLYVAQAHLAMLVTQYRDALAASRAAFDVLEDSRDTLWADAQMFAGAALGPLGEVEAGEEHLRKALAAFRKLGIPRRIAGALQYLGISRLGANDFAAGMPLVAEALEIFRATPGGERSAAHLASTLGEAEFLQSGDADAALKLTQEALDTDRALGNEDGVVFDLCNIAAYLIALNRAPEAAERAREAFVLARDSDIEFGMLLAMQHLASVTALGTTGEDLQAGRDAAALLGFVDRKFAAMGFKRYTTEQREYDLAVAAFGRVLGSEETVGQMTRGAAWSEEKAAAAALGLQ